MGQANTPLRHSNGDLFLALLFAATLSLTGSLGGAPARSQQIEFDHVVEQAERQRMLLEKMSKESVLLALQINPVEYLAELKKSQERFNAVRLGLRDGDPALGLPTATNQEVSRRLSLVDDLWPMFDDTVRTGIQSGAFGRTEIDTLAEMGRPLLEALDDAVEAYTAQAVASQLYSLRSTAVGFIGRQRTLTQKMAKEFFLISYRHEARRNKSSLKKSMARFGESMDALLRGDNQQKLIAPPNSEIRRQLQLANAIWQDFRTSVETAMNGKTPGREEILRVSELNMKLLEVLEEAVNLYKVL